MGGRVKQTRLKLKGHGYDSSPGHHTVTGQRQTGVSMKQTTVDSNPPYGAKGAFRKITMTLPPEAYERLVQESARRKIAREPNQLLSALLREAVTKYLDQLDTIHTKLEDG